MYKFIRFLERWPAFHPPIHRYLIYLRINAEKSEGDLIYTLDQSFSLTCLIQFSKMEIKRVACEDTMPVLKYLIRVILYFSLHHLDGIEKSRHQEVEEITT